MLATKVACPHCQATLKSARPIPPGTEITCPKCRAPFKAPAAETNGVTARRPAAAVTAASPAPLPSTSVRAGAAPVPAQPAQAPEPPGNRALPWLIGGGALFAGLGAFLIYWCFFTGGTPASEEKTETPSEIPEVTFKPLPPRPLIPLSKEEQNKIDDMVTKAVAFLKKKQLPDGTWPFQSGHGGPKEMAAFAGMTLLECGVKPNDPAIVKAAKVVRDNVPSLIQTYGISMALLFLDRLGDSADTELIQQLAARLVAGQLGGGGWGYNCRALAKDEQAELLTLLKDLGVEKLAEYRKLNPQKKQPPKLLALPVLQDIDRPAPKGFDGADNSNTQFAMLALWAARRRHLPLDRPLHHVVHRFRTTQTPQGSWNYHSNSSTNPAGTVPTMTCPGLIALAMGYGLNPPTTKGTPLNDEAIARGLTHLAAHIDKKPPKNPKDKKGASTPKEALPMMYFLWSVERVAVLYNLPKIMDKDWYMWGMNLLLSHQRPDGSWQPSISIGYRSDILDTCFALLFLQRANLAQDLTDKLQGLNGGGNGGSDAAITPRRE
jgi:hypothetical protein